MGFDLLNQLPPAYNPRDFIYWDDFVYTVPSFWTSVLTDTGSATIGVGSMETGAVELDPSDATVADNDEAYVYGLKVANLRSGAGFGAAWCFSYTEANADDANLAFGLCKTAPIANFLLDDGGGVNLIDNNDGFYISKIDGETVWRASSSWSGATGGAYEAVDKSKQSSIFAGRQVVAIEVTCRGLYCDVVFKTMFVPSGGEPSPLVYASAAHLIPTTIKHSFKFSSSTALLPVMAIKNGAANLETCLVDWFCLYGIRS